MQYSHVNAAEMKVMTINNTYLVLELLRGHDGVAPHPRHRPLARHGGARADRDLPADAGDVVAPLEVEEHAVDGHRERLRPRVLSVCLQMFADVEERVCAMRLVRPSVRTRSDRIYIPAG